MSQHHFGQCTLCEAMCGIDVETEGEKIVSIRGDKEDPFSQGFICPKAVALKDIHEDPDRLRHPVRRLGKVWNEVAWEEALGEAARRLVAIRNEFGPQSVAVYLGNPTVHSLGALLFAPLFVRGLRSRSRFSATSVDQLPHMLASLEMFGHQLLFPVPDLDRTDHFLLIGSNPAASNGSLMTAPGVMRRLEKLKARGGRLVVVDPRRTETAELADEHVFIRPGTDALLLLAMLGTLFSENRVRLGTCEPFTSGFEELAALVLRFPAERVAAPTGVPAATIKRLAREFASSRTAVCHGRIGVSTQEFGGLCAWLVNALNIVTGNFDVPGGALFPRPAVDILSSHPGLPGPGHHGKFRSRVRGLPEFGGELPAAALAEEIETPGPGQIRALVTFAGNPVLSTPNGTRLDRALSSLEFMLSIDIYVNETTRHAHLILPPTTALERDHYDLIFTALAVRNTAKLSRAVFEKPASARHDWEILNELTWRVSGGGVIDGLLSRAQSLFLSQFGPLGLVELGLRFGPYGDRFIPLADGLNLKKLEASPHGVDLGPLEPALPRRLFTSSRRIHLAPPLFVQDVGRLESRFQRGRDRKPGSLVLIGRRDLRSNNSWMHNSARLAKGPPRVTLLIHPLDAEARGITSGDTVVIRSRTGEVRAPAEVTDRIMRGVVSLPHGWGHGREGVRLSVASRSPGVSINDLTDDLCIDALTGNAAFSGIGVQVEPETPKSS